MKNYQTGNFSSDEIFYCKVNRVSERYPFLQLIVFLSVDNECKSVLNINANFISKRGQRGQVHVVIPTRLSMSLRRSFLYITKIPKEKVF